jgi:hypothetical protein
VGERYRPEEGEWLELAWGCWERREVPGVVDGPTRLASSIMG